jgi:hypothetical protein
MRDYFINIFYSEEDGGYIADIPDLEFCSAFGDSPEATLAELTSPNVSGSIQRGRMENRSLNLVTVRQFTKP